MKNRNFSVILFFLFFTPILFAGDIASFVNLGFSGDSKYFMFAQYGLDVKKSASYGEMYVVDIGKNDYVSNGSRSRQYATDLQPGQDGSGALYNILSENPDMKKSYSIDHLRQGRFLYILINGDPPKSQIEFRDFTTEKTYSVNLVQSTQGSADAVSSSFFIQLRITNKDGKIDGYTVGHPGYMRGGVRQYRIRQILLSPDGKSLVFVMEKETVEGGDAGIRYMVETVKIP